MLRPLPASNIAESILSTSQAVTQIKATMFSNVKISLIALILACTQSTARGGAISASVVNASSTSSSMSTTGPTPIPGYPNMPMIPEFPFHHGAANNHDSGNNQDSYVVTYYALANSTKALSTFNNSFYQHLLEDYIHYLGGEIEGSWYRLKSDDSVHQTMNATSQLGGQVYNLVNATMSGE